MTLFLPGISSMYILVSAFLDNLFSVHEALVETVIYQYLYIPCMVWEKDVLKKCKFIFLQNLFIKKVSFCITLFNQPFVNVSLTETPSFKDFCPLPINYWERSGLKPTPHKLRGAEWTENQCPIIYRKRSGPKTLG